MLLLFHLFVSASNSYPHADTHVALPQRSRIALKAIQCFVRPISNLLLCMQAPQTPSYLPLRYLRFICVGSFKRDIALSRPVTLLGTVQAPAPPSRAFTAAAASARATMSTALSRAAGLQRLPSAHGVLTALVDRVEQVHRSIVDALTVPGREWRPLSVQPLGPIEPSEARRPAPIRMGLTRRLAVGSPWPRSWHGLPIEAALRPGSLLLDIPCLG